MTAFNYSTLSEELQIKLKRIEERIVSAKLRSDWQIGKELYDAQQLIKRHGFRCFIAWADFIGYKYPHYFINIYKNLTEDDYNYLQKKNVSSTIIQLLTAPSTSDSLRKDTIKRIREGQVITDNDVYYLLYGHPTDYKVEDETIRQLKYEIENQRMKIVRLKETLQEKKRELAQLRNPNFEEDAPDDPELMEEFRAAHEIAKARYSAASKKKWENPELKARQSKAIKQAMNKPEVKARLSATMNRPEVKARQSAALKKKWENPELKARQSAIIKEALKRRKEAKQQASSTSEE